MKHLKKLLALGLVLCLILALAACAKNDTPTTTTAAPETTAAAPATTTAAPETTAAPGYELEEISVLDDDRIAIKITGMENDEIWGPVLKVEMENKTDKKLEFTVNEASVNGVSYFSYFDSELPAGKKANDKISFSDEELNETLGEFTDIWLRFRVREAGNWDADDLAQEEVHVYPLGQEAASRYVYTPDGDDKVLVDNEDCTVILTGGKTGDFWAYAMGVFVENKTDRTLSFTADDVSLNGYVCDPYWSVRVQPHGMSISDMAWSEDELKENGIKTVEELEYFFRVYESEGWLEGDLLKANVNLNLTNGDLQVAFVEDEPDPEPDPTNPGRTDWPDIPEDTDISPVVGSWIYRMNFKDAMAASGQLEDMEESMGEEFVAILEDLELALTLDLNEDASFVMGFDRDSALTAVKGMVQGLAQALPAMMAETYGMTMEEFNELLEKQGVTMEDLLAQMMESMNPEDMIEDLEESSAAGRFAYEDGKLYLASDDGGVSILQIELDEDELKIVGVEEDDVDALEGMEALYPMVFTRR